MSASNEYVTTSTVPKYVKNKTLKYHYQIHMYSNQQWNAQIVCYLEQNIRK
jgi:hypothetical protein